MNAVCEEVTERVALGEPLGELRDHIATCARCERVAAMPKRIAAAAERPDPGLGFAARMTIGAQNKLVVRRRRRIATTAAGGVAVAALAAFVLTRPSIGSQEDNKAAVEMPSPTVIETPIPVGDSDIAGLVQLADTKRAVRASANWGHIRRPLRPYIQLVKGVDP